MALLADAADADGAAGASGAVPDAVGAVPGPAGGGAAQSGAVAPGSVPLPRPAATGAPRTTWRGGVLPFSGDEDGNLHFDTDAGQIGSAKRAAMMPGEVWAGRIDPMSEEGIQGALELQGLLGLGPAGSAREGRQLIEIA